MERYTTVIDFRRLICISPSAARSFVSPDSISILFDWVKLSAKNFRATEAAAILTPSKG
jgi:hypothetical protein